MKKILLITSLVILTMNLKSQIVVNSIDLMVGDVVLQAVDTNFQTPLLAPGTDLSWDFSGIHGQRIDTLAPIDPATTTHGAGFPDANLAFGTTSSAVYFSNTTSGYVALGLGGILPQLNVDIEIAYSDPDTMALFPMNYGDSRTADAYGVLYDNIDIPTLGATDVKVSESVFRTQTVDAWGTVTTPHDSYDVLRVQEYEIKIDSAFIMVFGFEIYQEDYSQFDTTYRYTFYTNDPTIKFPLLEVKYNNIADTILEAKWITFIADQTSDLTLEDSKITIFPNPSSDRINISTQEEISSVKLFNAQGKALLKSQSKSIDISSLPAAMYFIEVQTTGGVFKEKLLKK